MKELELEIILKLNCLREAFFRKDLFLAKVGGF